jgi:hypothetical protein
MFRTLPIFLIGKIWLNIGICQTLGFSILKMSPRDRQTVDMANPGKDKAWIQAYSEKCIEFSGVLYNFFMFCAGCGSLEQCTVRWPPSQPLWIVFMKIFTVYQTRLYCTIFSCFCAGCGSLEQCTIRCLRRHYVQFSRKYLRFIRLDCTVQFFHVFCAGCGSLEQCTVRDQPVYSFHENICGLSA